MKDIDKLYRERLTLLDIKCAVQDEIIRALITHEQEISIEHKAFLDGLFIAVNKVNDKLMYIDELGKRGQEE